ncbi:Kelch-like protein 11 [Frankliniella fusca]|uniref:Kelch-like protein 11 n=1 Tax=Frankliniella fusca TaxID=407009 RepID=A0AAE1GWU5_9NEOP|nr:Kelch-like protein 11 [Frankliniella fusca]
MTPTPSTPLLLLCEQTVCRLKLNEEHRVPLCPLKTDDGRLSSLQSSVYYLYDEPDTDGRDVINLSVDVCTVTCPLTISCLMTGVCSFRSSDCNEPSSPSPLLSDKVLSEEAVIFTSSHSEHQSFEMLKFATEHPFDLVKIVFRVYEPHGGSCPHLGLHLNQARIDGGTLCDVKLVADDGHEMLAHSAVLGSSEPGDAEDESREGRILLKLPKDVLEKFLEFIYTVEVRDWGGSELELMELAERYMVPELRSACLQRLSTCDGLRALELLHADSVNADGVLGHIIGRSLRRRLTNIVLDNYNSLRHRKEWTDFEAACPYVVDIMMGSMASASQSEDTVTSKNLLLLV